MKKFLRITFYVSLIAFLSFFAIRPLFHLGFFPMHDDTQVARVQQMAQALKDGQFPVRWVADLGYGYGYPIFNFYAPLAYYVGGLFNLIGFSSLTATKIMFGLGIILASMSMFFLAREFWGKRGGVLAALFYVYAPYHAVQIFVRGSVAELWAYAFLPLVFLGLYRRHILLAGLSLAAIILSHNLTALMLTPFLILCFIVLFVFSKDKKLIIYRLLLIAFLALASTAFYWLPALAEMRLTKVFGQLGAGADWRDHFIFLNQLWSSYWGFAGSASGRLDGMSFMIGRVHLLAVLICLPLIYFFWPPKKFKKFGVLLAALIIFSLAVILTLPLSWPIWQAIPVMAFIQYPWRFLVFTALAASFMVGVLPAIFRVSTYRYAATAALVILLLVFNAKYFQPQKFITPDYTSEREIKWIASKTSDEYLPRDFPAPQNESEVAWEKVILVSGEAKISNAIFKANDYRFIVDAQTESRILVNLAWFPGWRVWVSTKGGSASGRDNQPIQPRLVSGRPVLTIPPGRHAIKMRFTNTAIRTLANLISLGTVTTLIYIIVVKKILGEKKKSGLLLPLAQA